MQINRDSRTVYRNVEQNIQITKRTNRNNEKNAITLISIALLLVFSFALPMTQINLYQQAFTDRYSFSEYGISGTAKNQSMDYINFMKGYLDANDLIRTPNSAGEEKPVFI